MTVYWSADFLMQQLSLQRLNADVRYNNNALKEFYDCIGGLLHLGQLLHLGLQQCAHQVHSVRLSNQ